MLLTPCHYHRELKTLFRIPKTRTSLCHLMSFLITSAEQWTVRNHTSIRYRQADSPHRAHTKYSHESSCRLDEFWQRPALTLLQSPQVSKSAQVWTFGFSMSSLFTPSSCLTASEARKETKGLSWNTQLKRVTRFLPKIPASAAVTSLMFLFLVCN